MNERYVWGGRSGRFDCSGLMPEPSSTQELQQAVIDLRAAEQTRTWRDAIRCAVGRHKPAASVVFDSWTPVQRCSCGALRMWYGRPWVEGDPFGRRRRAARKALERAVKQIEEAG